MPVIGWRVLFFRGGVALLCLIGIPNAVLWWLGRELVIGDLDELAARLTGDDSAPVVAVVPGARVFPGGEPSRPLADRIRGAVAIYERGMVDHVLVSGDHRTGRQSEPMVMRRELHRAGVPLARISVDRAGFDTWDSCRRAKEIFAADRVVFVTQQRYGRRSAALCRAAGLDAVVYAVPNPARYPRGVWLRAVLREPVAAIKGFYEVLAKPNRRSVVTSRD